MFFTKKRINKITDESIKGFNLQKLTPALTENMSVYNESLDFIFSEPDLLNVAITGAYSAGKSSVMYTYESINKDKKIIHISLAHFEDLSRLEQNGIPNPIELEGKILNQLIHQIDSQNIPLTRFKVKSHVTPSKIISNTASLGTLTLFSMYIIKFKEWANIIKSLSLKWKDYLLWTTNSESRLLAIVVSSIIILGYLYKIIKVQMQRPLFKKIKLQNNEIEMFDKNEESYFDKYLDEILYLFQNARVDAIVFEDMDRYNNNSIFNKLREINYLVNKKLKHKPVRFFYLLRDDIFTSKDRTKFFDFIMPVVPVIDSSNSYNKILSHFQEGGILENFDKYFLERLSLYIDDMRLLKNIYNEYVVYNGRIQSTELDNNKLLAIIVYKNIFPNDFGKLQLNSGYVFSLFSKKESYVELTKNSLQLKITQNTSLIEEINNEFLDEIDELVALFFSTGQQMVRVNNKFDNAFPNRKEFIAALRRYPSEYYSMNSYGNTFDFESVLSTIEKNAEYIKRKDILEQKKKNKVDELNDEIMELQSQIIKLDSLRMHELITRSNIQEIFDESRSELDVIDSPYFPLIKFLVRNGYIDETYFDYLTYFYENSLTRADKIFLRSVTDKLAKDHSYSLKNLNMIVNRLKESDFEQEEILNYDLLSYLLEQNHRYLSPMLNQIKNKQLFNFVWGFLNLASTDTYKLLVKDLNQKWSTIWVYLLSNEKITENQKKRYMTETLTYSSIEQIENMNYDSCVTSYISTHSELLSIDTPPIDIFVRKFSLLRVKFEKLDYENSNKELFKAVYEENLYVLNALNLNLPLEKMYNIPYSQDFLAKNYTLISSQPSESLNIYIENYIDEYILLILSWNVYFNDDEDYVLKILNNDDIEIDNKISYVEKLKTMISDLKNIVDKDGLWRALLSSNTVNYSSENVLVYYFEYSNEFDEVLTVFLNNGFTELSFSYHEIEKKYGEEKVTKWFEETVCNNQLTDGKYEMLLRHSELCYEEFDFKSIDLNKFEILIKLGIIEVNKINLIFVRAHYLNCLLEFISQDINNYINILDDELKDKDEISKLLSLDNISDENKIRLLEKAKCKISISRKNYSDAITVYIMTNLFVKTDLRELVTDYGRLSQKVRRSIEVQCVKNIEEVSDYNFKLSVHLIDALLNHQEITNEFKRRILANNFEILSLAQIKVYMSKIDGAKDLLPVFEGKRPRILADDINKKYLDYFKSKGWVASYEFEAQNPQYYRVFGKRHWSLTKD